MFWVGYLVIATLLFALVVPVEWALLRMSAVALVHIILVYFHLYVLLPHFFDKKKYVWYGILLLLALSISVSMKVGIDEVLLELTDFNGPLKGYRDGTIPLASGFVGSLVFLFITTPVRWMDEYYKRKELQQEFQMHRLEAELRFLKTQVNPHFLFNTLNNLYSLAYIGSEHTAPTIMKLSEMMRYMLYESDSEQVPLEKEINYLNNFIELQKLKTEEEQKIFFRVEGDPTGLRIPPLLFVPLFENAFKHGNLEDGGWLKSKLKIKENVLTFSMENSFSEQQKKDDVGGIGLENVKKRLALLFPQKHEFQTKSIGNTFAVDMVCEI